MTSFIQRHAQRRRADDYEEDDDDDGASSAAALAHDRMMQDDEFEGSDAGGGGVYQQQQQRNGHETASMAPTQVQMRMPPPAPPRRMAPPPPPPVRTAAPAGLRVFRRRDDDDEGEDAAAPATDAADRLRQQQQQEALRDDPLAQAVRAMAALNDGNGDGSGGGGGMPDEEWIAAPMRMGIFKYYRILIDDTAGEDLHSSYCAACNCNESGRLPPISDEQIKMMEDAFVKGIKTGRILRSCREVQHLWNHVIREDIERVIRTEENTAKKLAALGGIGKKRKVKKHKYDPFPEWTFESILQHLLYHTNDPIVFGIRNTLKVEALGDLVAMHGVVQQHTIKKDANGEPVIRINATNARTAASLLATAMRMNNDNSKRWMPKSGGKDSSGNQMYQQPGQGMTENMYRNTFQARKRRP
jgi:hypothetical protein